MVGISSKYNSPQKIAANKAEEQARYIKQHGNRYFFNMDGTSTPYHEMGHVYADKKGIPTGFEEDAKKWYREAQADMLKSTGEAWAEAWGAYHTGNKELPDYIAKYIENATQKPIAKSDERDIIDMWGEGMYRKHTEGKIEPMPKKQLNKIVKGFKKQGGVIVMNDEVTAHLKANSAEGVTWDAKTILLTKNPGRGAVFEELIHATQFRQGKIDATPRSRIICEIEAQEKLIKYSKAYKLTDYEVEQTKKALEEYKSALRNLD